MKEHAIAKAAVFEVVDKQLLANDPPETRQTCDRLIAEGYSEEEVKVQIACVVTAELFAIVKNQEPFNLERYIRNLSLLPQLPLD